MGGSREAAGTVGSAGSFSPLTRRWRMLKSDWPRAAGLLKSVARSSLEELAGVIRRRRHQHRTTEPGRGLEGMAAGARSRRSFSPSDALGQASSTARGKGRDVTRYHLCRLKARPVGRPRPVLLRPFDNESPTGGLCNSLDFPVLEPNGRLSMTLARGVRETDGLEIAPKSRRLNVPAEVDGPRGT